MPQLPIIIPVIVIGILVGSMLRSNKPKIPFRKVTVWALVSGVLNAAFAYAEYIMTPQPTFTFRSTSIVAQTSDLAFTAGSFIAGFLVVLIVFGIAAAYLRLRGGESVSDLETEEKSNLTSD